MRTDGRGSGIGRGLRTEQLEKETAKVVAAAFRAIKLGRVRGGSKSIAALVGETEDDVHAIASL